MQHFMQEYEFKNLQLTFSTKVSIYVLFYTTNIIRNNMNFYDIKIFTRHTYIHKKNSFMQKLCAGYYKNITVISLTVLVSCASHLKYNCTKTYMIRLT